MTISTESSVVTYIGNGSTTSFPFSFVGVSSDDISVIYTDTSGTQTTLDPTTYTLVLTPAAPGELWGIGGTVTYPNVGSPIALNTQLSVVRNVPYTQDVSISNQGAFYPKAVEQGLDLLELQLQQTNTDVTYAIKTPITDPTPPGVLPPAAERANLYLGFDSLGQPTVLEGVAGSGGNVSSVALSAPAEFVVTGSPITTTGTLTLTKATETANEVYAGPTTGSPAQPTFRILVPEDLPVATSGTLGAVRPDNTSVSISGGVLSVASGQADNPTATAGPIAVNGTSTKFMRADAAPAVQLGTDAQKGIVQVDGTTITASSGVISAIATVSGANPTATAGPVATNGVATTYMRSDAAPAVQKASSSQFGIVEVDGTTITASGGVISAAASATGANPTATAGPTAVNGTAPTFLRSDGAPAVQLGSSSQKGIVQVDNTTITAASGVITAVLPVGANPTGTAGNTAVNGVATTFMRSDGAPAIQLASSSLFGLAKVDNVTIGASGGTISVIGTPAQVAGQFPYSPTAAASFTNNINGGSGSISIADVSQVGTVMTYGAQANSGQARGYDMAWTAGKTVTARLKTVYLHQFCGTFIYFTDGTKVITFGLNQNGGAPRCDIDTWTNPASFNATVFSSSSGPQLDTMIRVVDDGTNYVFYVSADGTNWVNISSVVRGAFLTATRVGFGANLQTNVTTATGFVTQTYWTLV